MSITITDENGAVIEVNARVRAWEGIYEPDPGIGVVLAISDPEDDVDTDTGRTITHEPRITVQWPDGTTDKFTASGWTHTPSEYDNDGEPLDYNHEGVCDELLVIPESTKTIKVRYRGLRRPGKDGVSGMASVESGAAFAKALFDKGWATAQIFDESGREIGGVTTPLDRRRKRTWWGEN